MASEYVDKHLYNLRYDIYSEAEYGRNGIVKKEPKILWNNTIKNWNTVYAICIDKEYDYRKSIVGYTLKDFRGNTIRVNPNELKIAIALNKIDVINLSLFIGDSGELGKLTEINIYNVTSLEEINSIIQSRDSWEHYVVGNINIGYFEVYGNTTLLDYKGYCEDITLPSIKYMCNHLLSFNDYVKIVRVPATYNEINLGLCFGSRAVTDIYFYFNADKLIDIQISNCYKDGGIYKKLSVRDDVNIHALHFNMSALHFFEMMNQRKELSVQLKIKQSNVDTNDPLQKFILKSKMIGISDFNIDFSKRALISYNSTKDIDVLKLPPVKRLNHRWFNQNTHIGTLYLPSTLEMSRLLIGNIPNKEEYYYDSSTGTSKYKYTKLVDKIVIPKDSSIKFIEDKAAKLGIIFETETVVGTADEITVKTPNTGIKLKVIDFVEYPDITLKNGNTIYGHTRAVVEDFSGNRKSVMMNDLIDKVLDGLVQLTNADILLNKTIRIK